MFILKGWMLEKGNMLARSIFFYQYLLARSMLSWLSYIFSFFFPEGFLFQIFYFWIVFQGIYLVSVTKSGCLTVHDFEALYCRTHKLTCKFGFGNSVLLLKLLPCLWNLLDQYNHGYGFMLFKEMFIFWSNYWLFEYLGH